MKKNDQPTLGQKLWVTAAILLGLLIVGTIIAAVLGGDDDSVLANTAIIRISGPIAAEGSSSFFGGGWTSSEEIVELLEEARDDDSIEAVILEINSPGGSAVASDEIALAVKDVRAANKTVVAWIRESGASGAYWIASSSDHVVANRMSVTGSIGVISSYLEFDEFLDDWNVSYNRLTAGENKDVGDPFTNLTMDQRRFLQGKLDRVHGFFIEEVARNRNMTVEQVTPLADGRFFLGVEALEVGLVDELGGEREAIRYIENRLGITVSTVEYEPDVGFFEALFGAFGRQKQPTVMDYAQYAQAAEYARMRQMQQNVPVPMLR